MIPQNVTVLVRRIAGQMTENIVVFSSRKVIEDGSVASNRSVVTESVSKSCSSTEVQDEDAAIAAVIDGAELKWDERPSNRGQAGERFIGRHYGQGPLGGEAPPPGYVCRSCGVPGHFIKHCPQESHAPPPGYTCFRCQIPGHFIHHCPTIGDPKFDDYKIKMSRSLAPVVSANPVDGIPSALAPAASVSVVDDLPAELHCRLCNKVMADAVLTSKCCFDSFCDKCIRDYIITQSKCICGVKVLADDLIPNHTLRSTISNMLGTRASSTASGTGKHKSSSGSNPDPKLQSPATSAASGKDLKQDHLLSAASPDVGVQVAREDDQVDRPQKNLDLKSKAEGSAGCSVERAVPIADPLKQKDVSESTLKDSTISGTLEPKVARPDQLKKRKKVDSTKIVHPNNADYGYNAPFDPAYCNPFNNGYPPMVTDPYMYGSMGMHYGGYHMGPFGVNPFGNMPPQTPFGNMPPQGPFGNMPLQALAMQGYPANHQSWETHPALHRDAEASARSRQAFQRDAEAAARSRQAPHPDAEAAARSRQTERPRDTGSRPRPSERNRRLSSPHGREYDTGSRPRPSECNQRLSSPHGRESRSRSRSRSERRDHGRSDRVSNDYDEDRNSRKRMRASSPADGDKHSRRRMRASSPADGDKHSRRTSRNSSRSLARDDSSDDEQNFKRNWGHRSSVTMDARS